MVIQQAVDFTMHEHAVIKHCSILTRINKLAIRLEWMLQASHKFIKLDMISFHIAGQ